jgi:hypothetical protein
VDGSGAPGEAGELGLTLSDMESRAIMAISRAENLETVPEGHWEVLVIALFLLYAAILATVFFVKKHEFIAFEKVKDQYIQIDPFNEAMVAAAKPKLQGKGVVVKLNTMCNSLIEPSPQFNYLVFSQNMLGPLCATSPSEVNFVIYIKNENQQIKQEKDKRKVVYRLQKKVAIINWPGKALIAQKTFTKDYTFVTSDRGVDSMVQRKLCSLSAEPSDARVKQWIASLAAQGRY